MPIAENNGQQNPTDAMWTTGLIKFNTALRPDANKKSNKTSITFYTYV